MTQREILEGILSKYGETVSIKGNNVKGMIRPLQYKSGTSFNVPMESERNLNYLYTGPVNQRLSSGDEISANMHNYVVKRTDTAQIGGEDLYVWAVLGLLTPNSDKQVYLEADGKRVAVVGSYTEQCTQQSRIIAAWGEQEPAGTAPGRVEYGVTVENVIPADGVDLYALSDFSLIIVKSAVKVIYSGCRWNNITAAGAAGDLPSKKMVIVAARRTEIKEAENNGQRA